VEELREAMSIVPADTDWNPKRLINDMQVAISSCGSLLIIDEEDTTVRFTHHSVRQYLLSVPQAPDVAPYHIDGSQADSFMGEICVTYLNMGIFDTQLEKVGGQVSLNAKDIPMSIVGNTLPHTSVSKVVLRFLRNRTVGDDLEVQLEEFARKMRESQGRSPQTHYFLTYATTFWLSHCKGFRRNVQAAYHLWLRLLDNRVPLVTLPWAPERWDDLSTRFFRWTYDNGHLALFYMTRERLSPQFSFGGPELDRTPITLKLLLRLTGREFPIGDDGDYCHLLRLTGSFADQEFLDYLEKNGPVHQFSSWDNSKPGLACVARLRTSDGSVKLLLAREDIGVGGKTAAQMRVLKRATAEGWYRRTVVQLLLDALLTAVWSPFVHSDMGSADWSMLLFSAVRYGLANSVEMLIRRDDVDVNSIKPIGASWYEEPGNTALSVASSRGQGEIVELLLSRKDINVNIRDARGYTALHLAVSFKAVRVVRKLLERRDILVNAVTQIGQTALHLACCDGVQGPEITQALLAHGETDAYAEDEVGRIAFFYAVKHGGEQLIQLFFDRPDIKWLILKAGVKELVDVASRNGLQYSPLARQILARATDSLPLEDDSE
jgi:hypothetical protein